ncbi:hypothetical protein IQ243_26525 [Nostocales cyanobacterium LEGE 11386]|nr:hypothetical protein [Nostocales cyanobacterium LEGE 11386]
MPSICYVEAIITLEQQEKYNLDFLHKLDIQINEAEQDNSDNARLLLFQLEQSRTSFLNRNNDIKERFNIAFNSLVSKAEMITLNHGIFQETFNRPILEKHTMDKLIFECLFFHCRLYPDEIKIFLSSNYKEFGKREVTEILRDNGIQYFNKTQNFLGWLQSQSS